MSEIHPKFFAAGPLGRGENLLPMRRTGLCLTLGALLALGIQAPTRAAATGGVVSGCGGTRLVNLHTLHIEAEPRKEVYGRGETIVIDVTVTRPAEEDPAGEGNPMPRPVTEPAADVEVGGALWVGNTYRWDFGMTDEEGHAVLRVKMPRNSGTGWARAEFAAEKMHYSNNGCPDVREVGYRSYDRFVRVDP